MRGTRKDSRFASLERGGCDVSILPIAIKLGFQLAFGACLAVSICAGVIALAVKLLKK